MEGDTESLESFMDALEEACSRRERESGGSQVYLNVYDMIWVNDYLTHLGVGAYHTGVEVYGREHAYGGHPHSYTGVYDVPPKRASEVAAPGLKFRESFLLGHTPLSKHQVDEVVCSVGKEFIGKDYHIFKKNCNHFADELSMKLTGSHIPHWVNRLAYMGSWMPFILNCLPPSWVTPGKPEAEGQRSKIQLFSSFIKSPQSKSACHVTSYTPPPQDS